MNYLLKESQTVDDIKNRFDKMSIDGQLSVSKIIGAVNLDEAKMSFKFLTENNLSRLRKDFSKMGVY